MTNITVGLGERSYDIAIGDGLLDKAQQVLAPLLNGRRPVIVTDENVAQTQLPRLLNTISPNGPPIILPPGEGTKSWTHLAALCEELLTRGIERSDHIIAFGGGVIGDLVGFAASLVKRGCHFIQIPTTLLAQVDSSVGGKTAINVAAGKNLIGAFYQPRFVLIDPSVLDTLSAREMRAGYAEVVKYGLIDDRAFFEWCEQNGSKLIGGDRTAQLFAIENSVRAKARIVAADERETMDLRALLNLGHTFGHALEAETGYSDKLLHGEAVAAGIALAFQYSARLGFCEKNVAQRVSDHLNAAGLKNGIASVGIDPTGERLVEHMLHDKKMSSGTLPFILAHDIGQAFVSKNVELSDVAAFLNQQ